MAAGGLDGTGWCDATCPGVALDDLAIDLLAAGYGPGPNDRLGALLRAWLESIEDEGAETG